MPHVLAPFHRRGEVAVERRALGLRDAAHDVLLVVATDGEALQHPRLSVHEQVLQDGGEITQQHNVEFLTCALTRWPRDATALKAARFAARRRVEYAFDIGRLAGVLWAEYEQLFPDRQCDHRPSTYAPAARG